MEILECPNHHIHVIVDDGTWVQCPYCKEDLIAMFQADNMDDIYTWSYVWLIEDEKEINT